MLKYMRKEVVQNEEFLDRINEVEYEKDVLEQENQMLKQQVYDL